MSSPALLSLSHRLARSLQRPLLMLPFSPLTKGAGGIGRVRLPFLSRWTRAKDLPLLPPRTFHEIWQQELSQTARRDT